jgi:hypothetical protein
MVLQISEEYARNTYVLIKEKKKINSHGNCWKKVKTGIINSEVPKL